MAGVAVGGALTYLTQRTTQRAAERAEGRRRAATLVEERRAEQIRTLLEFIRCALEAEGVAHARPPRWDVGDEWYATARPAMDGLRIAEKGVELLCAPGLHAPTAAYARALNQAVWQERGEGSLGERLEPFKAEFLTVARHSLT
ncbi:hypothetical protein M271_11885 [Streptomyces rapamycinicus NRRL 5491]|uniref:Uncharacterized protein n=2 Tax=Streptomyces rapamycinicus TaxID=1226757 RepID=A0A0A0NAM4_STRRN|nr:hypothetical protein M271_11885 [Streptomyces rapamycinicus NRRL 5491]RLV73891.1 hypothetical protein D3C57_131735 [Streptomyces rapamycinicus NRRL 5491]